MDRFRNFGFLLKDVARLYVKRFEERAQGLSLTLPQCKALAFLAKNEGITQKRLAESIEVDPMTLVRILDRMEADGWVERRSDPGDRRARSLWVTEKSKPVIDHIWHLAAETRAEAFEGLSTEARIALIELLERVHGNLSQLAPLAVEELHSGPPAAARRAVRSAR
ncbi:MAG TPA: MarR family transcriptional regulator [Steroidobacteraceae bacterium]|nr:MarR family transcriptional regulator [Steroidobacteraceae bacterium]